MKPEKQIFFELRCAFSTKDFIHKSYTSDGEKRTIQFVKGFESFFYHLNKHVKSYENVYIVDNTLQDKSEIDKRILDVIPSDVKFIFSKTNNYGKHNKGAGDIEGWNYNKELISNYEYIFHHEPRQILLNFNLYESFLKYKTNVFCNNNAGQFWTGTWAMQTKLLIEYLNFRSAESLVAKNESIETDIYNFFKNKQYKTVEKVGVLWHDEFTATDREY